MRSNYFIFVVCLSLSIVSADRVSIDWDNSYHQTDCANSNTPEAVLNTITAGYYSILHNDNDKIHIEFSFNQTVFDIDMLIYVYDYSQDYRITRIMSSKHFNICTVGVTYIFEKSGFPRESQGIYIVFLYRINSTEYESYVIKGHNGISFEGIVTNLGIIVFNPTSIATATHSENATALDILSGETVIADPLDDPITKRIIKALDEVLEKNPLWALLSGMQGLFIIIETWNSLFDLFSNPEGRIMEVVLTVFIVLGVMLIKVGKFALGLILIMICSVPMVGSDGTVLGALMRPLYEETFGRIW